MVASPHTTTGLSSRRSPDHRLVRVARVIPGAVQRDLVDTPYGADLVHRGAPMPPKVFRRLWVQPLSLTERRLLAARPLRPAQRALVIAHPDVSSYLLQLFALSNPSISLDEARQMARVPLTGDVYDLLFARFPDDGELARTLRVTRLSDVSPLGPRARVPDELPRRQVVLDPHWSPPTRPLTDPAVTVEEAVSSPALDVGRATRVRLGADPVLWRLLLAVLAGAAPDESYLATLDLVCLLASRG